MTKRNNAIKIISQANKEDLNMIKKFRIRNGDNGWKWNSGSEQYDQSGDLRKAIDDLLLFTSLEGIDLANTEALQFNFQKNQGAFLSPLSDHLGVFAEVSCF